MALTEKLTGIADAIRGKTGKTEALTLEQMATEIATIETGGGGYTIDDLCLDNISGDIVITAERIRKSAFRNMNNIREVTANNCTTLEEASFWGSGVTKVVMEKLASTDAWTSGEFRECTSLKEAYFPSWRNKDSYYTFYNDKALEFFDGAINNIRQGDFQNCNSLKVLVLRYDGVVNLQSVSNLTGTTLTNGELIVYVPAKCLEAYKTATNWSTKYTAGNLAFVAIEGSVYE